MLVMPGPRGLGDLEDSKYCSFLWRWLGGHTVFFPHGSCRSCEVPEVALRTQVSVDLWGSPGAMAEASLGKAGAEVSR